MALTNAYIFNGLVQDKDTFIAQPYLTLNFMLYEGEGYLNDASFTLHLWASIHDVNIPAPKTATPSLKDWYEFDISPGFSFTFAKNLEFHDQRLHLHLAGRLLRYFAQFQSSVRIR